MHEMKLLFNNCSFFRKANPKVKTIILNRMKDSDIVTLHGIKRKLDLRSIGINQCMGHDAELMHQ